jgi:hypothetical protein
LSVIIVGDGEFDGCNFQSDIKKSGQFFPLVKEDLYYEQNLVPF